jgi:hypothetical protein
MDETNQVTFAGVVDGKIFYSKGTGDTDPQLNFYLRAETRKGGGRDGVDVNSRQEIQLWGDAAEDWKNLKAGEAVQVIGRIKTWKDHHEQKRLAIAVEHPDGVREAKGDDVNEVVIEGEFSDRRYFPPRKDKQAFLAGTLFAVSEVDGHELKAYVPVRVFGRLAEDIEGRAGNGAVLRITSAILKHERRGDGEDATYLAVVIADDHLGEVEVLKAEEPKDDDRGDRRGGGRDGGGRGSRGGSSRGGSSDRGRGDDGGSRRSSGDGRGDRGRGDDSGRRGRRQDDESSSGRRGGSSGRGERSAGRGRDAGSDQDGGRGERGGGGGRSSGRRGGQAAGREQDEAGTGRDGGAGSEEESGGSGGSRTGGRRGPSDRDRGGDDAGGRKASGGKAKSSGGGRSRGTDN